jgi:hypothetical protein
LNESLSSFLGHDKTVHPLAKVLPHTRKVSRISYNEIEKIINDNAEDVVLTGCEWRLLIPIKSTRETLDWESKIFSSVHKEYPGIVLATMYRTLDLLTQMGLILEFDFKINSHQIHFYGL